MKEPKMIVVWVFLLIIVLVSPLWSGTTGKIAGSITDKATGESLPGANIVVVGTSLGASSDINGEYTILYIPPGTYSVQISCIGYKKVIVSDVRVYIDQTARIDVKLEPSIVEFNEMVVFAERNTIKPDVATGVVDVSGQEITTLPVTSDVRDIMGMQAGINNDQIRGAGLDQALFMVDGVTMRDPRNNQALTKVAMSAIREISIERGGFNAEYGQVQSGIVNVVTNEGKPKGYSGSISVRMTPPTAKYFQGSDMPDVHDPNSYWLRPYFDPAVCWTGTTSGAWDTYTQSKYLIFDGWNAISKRTFMDNDPNNNLTPQGAQRVFEYETRKRQIDNQPDYEIDGGFGGPVPFISEQFGNLRFFASYRAHRDILLFPTTRPDYKDYDARVVISSDISNSMKLRFSALTGNISTLAANNYNAAIQYPHDPANFAGVALGTSGIALTNMFSDWTYGLSDIQHSTLAAKFIHMLSKETYYEVSVEYFRRHYDTRSPAMRDTSQKFEVLPGYFESLAPMGVFNGKDGLIITEGNQNGLARDQSTVSSIIVKADFSSQINFNNLLKSGIEFDYNDLDLNFGWIQMLTGGRQYAVRTIMHPFPIRASAYIQDKLETKGFILNAGLRLDYSNSRTDWWTLDPYNPNLYSYKYNPTTPLDMTKPTGQWQLSPRLGISHPITENSKLYFNYGHFKQMPQYEAAYRFDRGPDNSLARLGNPNLILAKTISYELGYDHQLFDGQLLLQLSAFYRDVSNQQNTTNINPAIGSPYTVTTSTGYSDIRGFEFTLRKPMGRWFFGFLNYTYQATSNGSFGETYLFEDQKRQQDYDENTVNTYQTRSIPSPYARANLNFSTPPDFGPTWIGHHILGDFMINLLLRWNQGGWTTYNPNNAGTLNITNNTSNKIQNNVQYVDYYDATVRVSKSIAINRFIIQFYADISNLFNTMRLFSTGDQSYRKSLHLPKSDAYNNIPGDDKFGSYRTPGVEWQPEESGVNLNAIPSSTRAIYYNPNTGTYWQYTADQTIPNIRDRWSQVEQKRIDQINKDKAYIDMPNPSTYWFLNPRNITYGICVSFDID